MAWTFPQNYVIEGFAFIMNVGDINIYAGFNGLDVSSRLRDRRLCLHHECGRWRAGGDHAEHHIFAALLLLLFCQMMIWRGSP
jgi:hypothetical protein